MDEVFFLDEETRGKFIEALAQALGCTYLCLWLYYPFPSNRLFSIHGWFNDNTADQPSSSSHQVNYAHVRTLFDSYRQMLQIIENGCVPGLAFKEGVRYLELKEFELMNLASSDTQRKFYQEARTKKSVFLGCKSGEIEIGISNPNQQINIEMVLKNWFPTEEQHSMNITEIPQSWNVSSSYSSPLQSLSVGSSPESSSFHMLNIPIQSSPLQSPILQNSMALVPPPSNLQHPEICNNNITLSYEDNIRFPNAQNDDAAMTRAMLAVISSASSSSSCQKHITQDYANNVGAFRKYVPGLSRHIRMKRNSQGQHRMKRAILYYRNMYIRRKVEEHTAQLGTRPTTAQLHHKMSERRRREKLNESFESLRSLLPSSSKKDKASLLSNTREYLGTLQTEVSELKQKCRLLEARLLAVPTATSRSSLLETGGSSSSNRNVEISITQASEPTTSASEAHEIYLQVNVRGDYCNNMMDLVLRILQFLKQVEHITLVTMEAETQPPSSSSFHRAVFRLRVQDNEFDNSSFQEAIQRIIDDLAK